MKHAAYIGFGSNLGDRNQNIRQALEALDLEEGCRVEAVSPLYSTEPVDYEDQEWFVNGAARIRTSLEPAALLKVLKSLEVRAGRTSGGPRFGPRKLDMDILLYDDLTCSGPDLEIPHPRMDKRRFVLTPLCDIAPNLEHPVLKQTVSRMLETLDDGGKGVIPAG